MNNSVSHLLGKIFITLLVIAVGIAVIKKHVSTSPAGLMSVNSDVLAFVKAGADMLHGKNIYESDTGERTSYVYLPFYAFMNIPLTFLPPLAVDAGWYLLNIVLLGLSLAYGYELFTNRPSSSLTPRERWILFGGSIVLSLRYLVRNAQDANINLLILFLIVISIRMSQRSGKPYWAAIIGIAAAIKILPLIFVVYFAAKRKWREIFFVMAAFLFATLLPVLLIGVDQEMAYLRMFAEYSRSQFSPQGLEVENFSIWGTLGRLLTHNPSFEYPNGSPVFINIENFNLNIIRYCVYFLNISLIGLLYGLVRRDLRSGHPLQGRIANTSLPLTLLCMNLVSILTEDHHTAVFVLIYLYLLINWRERRTTGDFFIWKVAISGVLSLLISYDVIVPLLGKYAYMILLAYSLPVLPVGILLFILVLTTMRPAERAVLPTTSRTS